MSCSHSRVVLTFWAPVYVTVEMNTAVYGSSSPVTRVRVNDEIAPKYELGAVCADCGEDVGGPHRWIAVQAAENAESWPGWEF